MGYKGELLKGFNIPNSKSVHSPFCGDYDKIIEGTNTT